MGIVKISDDVHEELRIASQIMSRSINSQAEHWIRIGKLLELNPNLTYSQLIQQQFDATLNEPKHNE
jgi:hypothetical protein